MKYTHHNNELNLTHLKTAVYLKGWVQKARNLGGLIFIDLRDRFGITQLVVRPEQKDYATALKIRSEFVIEVKGTVIERESKNKHLPTGDIEIAVTELTVLSEAKTPPIVVADDTDALEDTRLKYRYLDLRRPVMQNYLIQRHLITQAIRQYLVKEQFYELETPILGKSTPEGARDYLVPSRLYPGQFYALPQSPQIYKQLFMVSGFERYFQIAKCFRDEDLRSDRQPEFTQVDIEASFIEEADVYQWIEGLMQHLFKTVLNKEIQIPFQRLTYETAVQTYGSDKPDLRFGLMFEDYQPLFKALEIPLFENKQYLKGFILPNGAKLTRRQIDQYTDLVKKHHGEALVFLKKQAGIYSGSIHKWLNDDLYQLLNLNDEDILFIVPGNSEAALFALGELRNQVAKDFGLTDPNDYVFCWITDWPLLEYDEEENRYYAKHHPFTQPQDVEILRNKPAQALARAYDIVLNGYEIGGGSLRIHQKEMQKLMFDTLGISEADIQERFGFFVEALQYGTPPHGGIALGLDRIVMLMTHTHNIKDVIAFPKTQSAKDLMMDAPSEVAKEQLTDLKIKVE